jgi:hypothetical protein
MGVETITQARKLVDLGILWQQKGLQGVESKIQALQERLGLQVAQAAQLPEWQNDIQRQRAIAVGEIREKLDTGPLLTKEDHIRLAKYKQKPEPQNPVFPNKVTAPEGNLAPITHAWRDGLYNIEQDAKVAFSISPELSGFIDKYKAEKQADLLKEPHPFVRALDKVKERTREFGRGIIDKGVGVGGKLLESPAGIVPDYIKNAPKPRRDLGTIVAGGALGSAALVLVGALIFGRPAQEGMAADPKQTIGNADADCRRGVYIYNDQTMDPKKINGTIVAGATPAIDCVEMTATAQVSAGAPPGTPEANVQFVPAPSLVLPEQLKPQISPVEVVATPFPKPTLRVEITPTPRPATPTPEPTPIPQNVITPVAIPTTVIPESVLPIQTPEARPAQVAPATPPAVSILEVGKPSELDKALDEFLNQEVEITKVGQTVESTLQFPKYALDWETSKGQASRAEFVKEYWRLLALKNGHNVDFVRVGDKVKPVQVLQGMDKARLRRAMEITDAREAYLFPIE